jgi:hypothetical protein
MTIAMAEEPLSQAPLSARPGTETGEHDDGLSAFAGVRPCLFDIAYRMLGSAAELVDVVEEVPQLCCKPIKKAAASQSEGLQNCVWSGARQLPVLARKRRPILGLALRPQQACMVSGTT